MSDSDSTSRRFFVAVCCIVSILFCVQNAIAEYGTISFGYQANFWTPYGTDHDILPVVEYETEGLMSARLAGTLGFEENQVLFFLYEAPVSPSDEQNEMLEINETKESGLEKFTYGIKLDPIAEHFFPNNTLLRKLLSVRFKYTRELYMGRGEAIQDAYYVPMDAKVDYASDPKLIIGKKFINKGDTLALKAEFEDYEASINLLTIEEHNLRIGYYESRWKRLSDTSSALSIYGFPVIYEAEYRSRGLKLKYDGPVHRKLPGLYWECSIGVGYDDEFKTAYDWQKTWDIPEDDSVKVESRIGGVGLWYEHEVFVKYQKRWLITVGLSSRQRDMKVDFVHEEEDEEGNVIRESTTVIEDVDRLTKFYISLNYLF